MTEEGPQLHIDSDWKAEAQAEKERLAAAEEANPTKGAGEAGQLPEASFRTLMSMLASQALMGLGTMADPERKGVMVDLEGSKLAIDLLGVLEEKTRGNLEEQESEELKGILGELRARFVELSNAIAQQMAGQTPPDVSGPVQP